MGRGRGNRGGGGGGGGGRRGGGGRGGRGGGGGGRGGRGRGGGFQLSRKEVEHIEEFGEAHPSADKGSEFGGGQSRGSSRGRGRGGWGRGAKRGRFEGRHGDGDERDSRRKRRDQEEEDSSEEEEEATPYEELLSMFAKSKGNVRKEVQIVSDEDEEESEEDEIGDDEEEDDEEDGDEGKEEQEESKVSEEGKKEVSKGSKKDEDVEDETGDKGEEETVIVEAELDPELEDDTENSGDPFLLHFEREMSEVLQTYLKAEKPKKVQVPGSWTAVEKFTFIGLPAEEVNEDEEVKGKTLEIDLSLVGKAKPVKLPGLPVVKRNVEECHIKPQIIKKLAMTNQAVIDKESCRDNLTPLQLELTSVISSYYDLYYPLRTLENEDAVRLTYCLHAANHILKTRTRILHHNAKMANKVDVPDAYRDQGFVRPKVLILAPFKDSGLKIIKTLISLFLEEEKGNVANKKRFLDEYGGSTLFLPKTNPKPDDYNAIFSGNTDDNYKIGISLTKKTVKLYTGFYGSDIIVASPLGLRLIIGAEGERDRDYDFLSSIELLIMDQADIFLMQNWDHVLHIMKHLHLQPVTTHGTDFARIRPWALDGLSKFYCQTLIFSSVMCPEHCALMSRYCNNYAGQIRALSSMLKGTINQVTVQLPQVFQYFESSSLGETDDARFEFFTKKVLPAFKEKLMSHTLVYVASYFDFVRLRNYFKKEEETRFVQICEYTKEKKVARARDYFFHGQSHFLLYTERVHFFRRFRLKGVGHILFYQLPQYPHFYSELCNSIREDFQNKRVRLRKNSSVNVIYCKYDTPRLAAIVGSERAGQMLSSEKKVHAFLSGEV